MVFRRPLGPRIVLILMALWMIALPLVEATTGRNGWVVMAPVIPVACLFGGIMVLLTLRRYELRLDLERHTYRLTYGWFFRSRVRSGSWQDFAGVFVRTARARGGEMSAVGLAE